MLNNDKFINFLESLSDVDNKTLIESVKEAYLVCFEAESTEPEVILKHYPRVVQANDWMCGPAVTHAALIFYGTLVFQEDLIKDLKTCEKNGTDLVEISKFFERKKFDVTFKENMSIDEVKKFIDKDTPVIIEIQAWGDNKNYEGSHANSHFVTVIGYNDRGFICEDPWIENRGFITFKSLNSRWHANATIKPKHLTRPGLAIGGRDPKFSDDKIVPIK